MRSSAARGSGHVRSASEELQRVRFRRSDDELFRTRTDRLVRDIARVAAAVEALRPARGSESDRLLAVLCARADALPLLRATLPNLIESVTAVGCVLELVLGLDVGFSAASEEELERICSPAELRLATLGEAPLQPAATIEPLPCHRVWALRNPGPGSRAGKIRLLSLILSRFLAPRVARGWVPPSRTLVLDAESHLFDETLGDTREGRAAALRELIEATRGRDPVDLVGTRMRSCVFAARHGGAGSELVPRLGAPVPALYHGISLLHGWFPGLLWLPGGGTLGKTDLLLGLLTQVCTAYPACRVEDVHVSVLARNMRVRTGFAPHAVSTNRLPISTEPYGAPRDAQLLRWLQGVAGLERLYGRAAIQPVAGGGARLLVRGLRESPGRTAVALLAGIQTHGLAELWRERRKLQALVRHAASSADEPERATAYAAW